ncbi:MAG: hypothetical protein Q8L64_00870 [bacterium]|nr:hypothetical protein [bacterium]
MAKSILIIEDDTNWQDTLGRLLKDKGYEVQLSAAYSDALGKILKTGAWFVEFDIGICIVDLRLGNVTEEPNYDGMGLLAVCRLRNIPTVVVSGYLTQSITSQVQNEFGVKAVFDKSNFADRAQYFLDVVKKELALQGKKAVKGDSRIGDVDAIKFSSKQQILIGNTIDHYKKAMSHINELQDERVRIRRRVDPNDEALWLHQIKELDEKSETFINKIKNAKTQEEIEDLHRELTEEFLKWLNGQ